MTDNLTDGHMEHIDFAVRDVPIETTRSADGTTIAFERTGHGAPVVIVGGGLNEKAMHAELAERLSTRFTVLNYDRRARGDSDDRGTGAYTVQREIEDLAAVIDAAGEPCHVFANCTGSMIAVPAAAQRLPMRSLAMYEPPYGGPRVPPGYLAELTGLLAEGRHTDAVALFLRHDALFTVEEIEFFKTHPIWPAFEAMAPSTLYDTQLSDDADRVPSEQLAAVEVPMVVLGGADSPTWMLDTCRAIAAGVPGGRFVPMPSAGHLMDDVVGADLLTDFYTSCDDRTPTGAAT